ncbi:MAG: RCC1 domain-containing protein [Kofleriaceae bacterium]
MRWPLLLLLPACAPTIEPPAQVAGNVEALSIAYTHTLVVGRGPGGAVRDVVSLGSDLPAPKVPVGPRPEAIGVAVGRTHACLLTPAGSVHCWGDHARGALGAHRACIPSTVEGGLPDCVLDHDVMPSLPPARALAAGDDVTCAILRDDRVVCWGEPGAKLGGSRLPASGAPTPVVLPGGAPLEATRLVISRETVCAIDHDARLWCWGDRHGATPTLLPELGVVDVAFGRLHSCMITTGEGLTCSGENANGQAGDVAAARACTNSRCPIGTTRIDLDAKRVVVGERHSCALTTGGQVVCWGSNELGQLGRDDAFLTGAPGVALDDAIDLAAGYAHTCAVRRDGGAWCWGETDVTDRSEIAP